MRKQLIYDVELVPDQVINLGDVAEFVACLLA